MYHIVCPVQVFHLAYFGDLSAELPDWAASLACTSHLLLVTNSSTNILVYCWKDRAVNEPSRRFTVSGEYRKSLLGPSPC